LPFSWTGRRWFSEYQQLPGWVETICFLSLVICGGGSAGYSLRALLLFGLRGDRKREELPGYCPELLDINFGCGSALCVSSWRFASYQVDR